MKKLILLVCIIVEICYFCSWKFRSEPTRWLQQTINNRWTRKRTTLFHSLSPMVHSRTIYVSPSCLYTNEIWIAFISKMRYSVFLLEIQLNLRMLTIFFKLTCSSSHSSFSRSSFLPTSLLIDLIRSTICFDADFNLSVSSILSGEYFISF